MFPNSHLQHCNIHDPWCKVYPSAADYNYITIKRPRQFERLFYQSGCHIMLNKNSLINDPQMHFLKGYGTLEYQTVTNVRPWK